MTSDNLAAVLAAREKELSAIYENVPGIVFYISVEPDGEFRFLSVSQDFLTATGLSRAQVVGSFVRDIIPPQSRDIVLDRYREAIRSGKSMRWEETSAYPSGQKYGEVAVTPVRNESGVTTHLIGIVHDITERKLMEERRSEDLLEAAPDAMVVVDQTGRIVLINAQTESLFGYQREEILGQHIEVLIPHRFHEGHQAHRNTFFSQPRIRPMGANLQLSGLRKDGTEFPVEIRLSPIQTSEGIFVTSAIRDITERKLAEESRLKLAAIVESSEDAIISKNLDGIITSWNAAAERIFGYTEAEAVGQPVTLLIPPELRDEEDEIVKRVKAGEHISHYEPYRVTKTGNKIDVSIAMSPIRDSTGRIVGFSKIIRDITSRKQAEDALRASEQRLRLAQQVAQIGTFERDLRTDAVICSTELDLIYGLSPGTFNGTNREFFINRIHPDDRAHVIELIEGAFQAGQYTTGEWRIVWPDGSIHWIIGRWQVFTNEAGRASRIVGVNVDITQRKMADEALRESEERLRMAQWAAHFGTFDLNLRTGVDLWQGEMEALFGLSRGEFGGTLNAFEELIHPDDRERIRALTRTMIQTGQEAETEWRVIWPDGSVHWIASRGRVITDESGQPTRMIGVNMDATERKRAEEALRTGEERFRLAAVAGRMFAYEWDVASDVIVRSGDFGHILGADEPIKTTGQQVLERIHPDDRQRVEAAVAALSPENPHLRITYRMRRRDGSLLWVERTSRAHFDGQRTMVRIIGMLADVTERKQAEIALSEMTRKLIDAQEQERARISRELHDDINQRIAMLSVEAEQLREDPSEIDSRVQQFRTQIREISNDVQALSHDLHSSKLEYLGAVAGIKSWCREFAERQKLEIDFRSDVSGPLPSELGVNLFRILQEGLHNAMKHSGVKRLEVRLGECHDEVYLIISDSGNGFDINTALQGKGLGLTSMRERVRLVNGTISIESKPMGGTTIHVRVPLTIQPKTERMAG